VTALAICLVLCLKGSRKDLYNLNRYFLFMNPQVKPPKPATLLTFFTFMALAGSLFIILPVVLGLLAVVVASVELMVASNNVSGDFSNIVIGDVLWRLAGLPYEHWIVFAGIVVLGTAGFVGFTRLVNPK